MPGSGLFYLPLSFCCLLGCATQTNSTGPDTISIQIGVTETNPAGKSLGLAQEHCAKRGRNAVLSSARDQVIFEYVCR